MRRILTSVILSIALWRAPAAADPSAEAPRPDLVRAARAAANEHRNQIRNASVLAIIDYSLPSHRPRLFLIDAETGESEAFLVAHGRGSDPDFDGQATHFSNIAHSKMSSLGAYATGQRYRGIHGLSLKLTGLDATNDRAQERAIVIHGAAYVAPGREVLGRSWGCPTIETRYIKTIIDRLKGGALLYIAD